MGVSRTSRWRVSATATLRASSVPLGRSWPWVVLQLALALTSCASRGTAPVAKPGATVDVAEPTHAPEPQAAATLPEETGAQRCPLAPVAAQRTPILLSSSYDRILRELLVDDAEGKGVDHTRLRLTEAEGKNLLCRVLDHGDAALSDALKGSRPPAPSASSKCHSSTPVEVSVGWAQWLLQLVDGKVVAARQHTPPGAPLRLLSLSIQASHAIAILEHRPSLCPTDESWPCVDSDFDAPWGVCEYNPDTECIQGAIHSDVFVVSLDGARSVHVGPLRSDSEPRVVLSGSTIAVEAENCQRAPER